MGQDRIVTSAIICYGSDRVNKMLCELESWRVVGLSFLKDPSWDNRRQIGWGPLDTHRAETYGSR